MKVLSKAYGAVEVDDRQRITFPGGLFGFESLKSYVLLDAERQPFYWLQSTEVEQLAFILVSPFLFRPDYEVDIGDEDMKEIGVADPNEALIFSIVTIPQDGVMTANLQGPLIINRGARLGMQAVLSDPRWKTKHDIMGELASARKAPC
ncbi:MAG: flagellar assembly protein FliW [Treponema sp.]|nr:flagellar assembly protein FliW [Treponema sp.]